MPVAVLAAAPAARRPPSSRETTDTISAAREDGAADAKLESVQLV